MRIFAIALGCLISAQSFGESTPTPARASGLTSAPAANAPQKSQVVMVQNPRATQLFEVNPAIVTSMLEQAMQTLTHVTPRGEAARGERGSRHEHSLGAAWRHYVQPSDVVGIKISTHAGPLLATHRPLVEAVVSGLQQAGVRPENIIVWDRFAAEMHAAGYDIRDLPGEVKYLATTPTLGTDEKVFYQSSLVGKPLWGDRDFPRVDVSDRSYLSRIITQRITKLINIPVLTHHRDAGLSGCLFNLAIGSVDNTRRFADAPWFYDPAVAEICAMEPFRQKTVLHILDALVAQYAGGPNVQPRFAWHFGTLYLSTDPVAIDTLALEEIEAQRAAHGLRAISAQARHIASAAELELGTNRRQEIELIIQH